MRLDEAVRCEKINDGTFTYDVPSGFGQGKATFGGLVLGVLVSALEQSLDVARPLRSLQAELLGAPQPGPATLTVRRLRKSSTMETLAAELHQGGDLMTHAVGIFGDARPVSDTITPRITLPPWQDVTPMPQRAPFAPEFTQHLEYRSTGPYPFTGAGGNVVHGWVRPREATTRDAALLMMLVDAWWLAAFTTMKAPRPAVTLGFALDVHAGFDGLPDDAPYYHRGEVVALADGYATETRELWGSDGRLLALNRQTVVIVK